MDTSSKLRFLKGDFKLRADEIDPSLWSQLVFDCIEDCKEHLNYFPEQHPIKDILNKMLTDYDRRITPKEVIVFPEGVFPETKCLEIARQESEYISHEPQFNGFYDTTRDGWKFIIENTLLLTCNDGLLLSWVAKYQPRHVTGLGFRAHRQGTYYEAESSVFSKVGIDDLERIIQKEPLVGKKIINFLAELVAKGINNRERNLNSMKRTQWQLVGVLSRIS